MLDFCVLAGRPQLFFATEPGAPWNLPGTSHNIFQKFRLSQHHSCKKCRGAYLAHFPLQGRAKFENQVLPVFPEMCLRAEGHRHPRASTATAANWVSQKGVPFYTPKHYIILIIYYTILFDSILLCMFFLSYITGAHKEGPPICRAAPPPIPRDPNDHINIRILQTMISGIPLILGLGSRVSDPYVYIVLYRVSHIHKVEVSYSIPCCNILYLTIPFQNIYIYIYIFIYLFVYDTIYHLLYLYTIEYIPCTLYYIAY